MQFVIGININGTQAAVVERSERHSVHNMRRAVERVSEMRKSGKPRINSISYNIHIYKFNIVFEIMCVFIDAIDPNRIEIYVVVHDLLRTSLGGLIASRFSTIRKMIIICGILVYWC